MQAILLGYVIPQVEADKVFSVDPVPGVHSYKFSVGLARSLRTVYDSVRLVSLRPIQNFPLARRILFSGGVFDFEGMVGTFVPFVNLLVLKHITRFFSTASICLALALKDRRSTDVFIHGTHTPLLVVGRLLQLFGFRVGVVVTDMPGVLLPTDGFVSRTLKRIDRWLVCTLLRGVQGVAGLSPAILMRYGLGRTRVLFEGILEGELLGYHKPSDRSGEPFVVGYAGGLTSTYGVDRLVEAVSRLDMPDIRLRIFGRGDLVGDVVRAAGRDSRISYMGFLTGSSLFRELIDCDLLVNPRPTNQEFAVLSFPSKIVEYMGLGQPVLTTRVAGLPEQYLNFVALIEDESVAGIQKALRLMMQRGRLDLAEMGVAGREFVGERLGYDKIGMHLASLMRNS